MLKLTRTWTFLTCILLATASMIWAGDEDKTEKKPDAKADTPEVEWLTYDQGIAKAKETGLPIVIDFYTDWCGYCKKMDRETFKNPKVIDYMTQKFVAVRVNGESTKMVSHKGEQVSERALTKAYRVRGFPTFWFLDSEGEPIGPAPGYKPTDSWMTLLEYVGETHYKKTSYENYVKSKSSDE